MKNTFILLIILLIQNVLFSQTPVEKYGRLKVNGTLIKGNNDSVVQLKGMSLFWSHWSGKYYNEDIVDWLYKDWNCEVVRAAMGIDRGGYLTNKETEKQKIIKVIEACIKTGIYVIVDWHDHHAEDNLVEAQLFFSEIARKYGSYPNIIYEIYNEPLRNSAWSETIKPYHEAVIDTIRKYDTLNLIICGTRSWSQDVDEASEDPLQDKNVAYAIHYYSDTHKEWLRTKAQKALDNGIALFVTEYGTCKADGDGKINFEETLTWWRFLDNNHISYCNWSVGDKEETSSALLPGADSTGGWDTTMLSPSGILVRGWMRGYDLSGSVHTIIEEAKNR